MYTARRITLPLAAALLAALLGIGGWWILIGSARVPPVPPPPPDEGQEARLYPAFLQSLVEKRPDQWQARVNLASHLLQEGRAGEAVTQLEAAVRSRPGDAALHAVLAVAAREANRADAEVSALSTWAKRVPADPEPRVRLSRLYRRLGWNALALRLAAEALRLAPESPDALRAHAVADFASEGYPTAAATAQRLIRVAPDDPTGYSILAACLKATGQWDRALEAARKAAELDPATISYTTELARLYMDRPDGPDYERALEVLDSARAADPQAELQQRYWRGICLSRLGKVDEALQELEAVRSRDPGFEEVAFHLSKLYRRKGDTARAREYSAAYRARMSRQIRRRELESAVQGRMGSAAAHLDLAKLCMEMDDLDRALFEIRFALRLKPGDAAANRLLQEALRKAGGSSDGAS